MDQERTTVAKRLLQHLLLWIIKKSFAYNSSCNNFTSGSVKQKPKINTLSWYSHVLFAEACKPAHRNQKCLDAGSIPPPQQSCVSAGPSHVHLCEQRSPKSCLGSITLCSMIRAGWANSVSGTIVPSVSLQLAQERLWIYWGEESGHFAFLKNLTWP